MGRPQLVLYMPELIEPIEDLNKRLLDHYGKFENGQPNWRIVWSDDQYELRHGEYERYAGKIYLGKFTGVLNVPKYKQWIPSKYVLERIVPVPDSNKKELLTKLSYEPVWVFENGRGKYLPPKWEVAVLVINSIHEKAAAAVGRPIAKYKDPDTVPEEAKERQRKKVDGLVEELFGNETSVTDALTYGSGVGYTGPSKAVN